ncbi:hypothetical protein P6144_13690 [Sphingomonas sp. HITSZ_GF]|uniref:hypothetical protein n=1 Tax=Sphingomonas sp. HITSZ_GF TaxID=3037247 RepID=UPI00240E6790|nr:hypothetical protein [Sphingomonas sp. HITSZ_GF]MDG2534709.1 hypothetical protein [Sphingomonas sp. HITSZ_GF]
MNAADLTDQFLAILLREVGGTRRRWRNVIGAVKRYSAQTHPHCNWSITPGGEAEENAAVERIADRLREKHPIID